MPADEARSVNLLRRARFGTPIEEARLVERIKEICAEWPSYGYRRVTAELQATGYRVNHKKVMRLMKEHGLVVLRYGLRRLFLLEWGRHSMDIVASHERCR